MAEGPDPEHNLAGPQTRAVQTTTTQTPPSLQELSNELNLVSDWHSLGVKLGVQPTNLSMIERNYHGDNIRCKHEMLVCWLETAHTPGPTWEAITDALCEMGQHNVAMNIRARYCTFSTATDIGTPSRTTTTQESQFPTSQQDPAVAVARRNIKMITGRFSMLVTRSRRKLQIRRISVEDVQTFLITMYSSSGSTDASDMVISVVQSATSLDRIFRALAIHKLWDYLNYYLLQSIIEEFAGDDDELNGMMVQYQRDLTGYILVLKIQTYLEATHYDETFSTSSPNQLHTFFKKLSAKVKANVTDHSLTYVNELWQSLTQQFALPRPAMILQSIAKGCIGITWLIPTNLVNYVSSMVQKTSSRFAKQDVLQVILDEQCIYTKLPLRESYVSTLKTKKLPDTRSDEVTSTSRTAWRFNYEQRRRHPPKEENVKLSLTIINYKYKFHALLYYEEEEHVRLLKDRCDGVYELTLYARDHEPKWLYQKSYSMYGFLVGMKGDQVMYATQASERVFLVDHGRDICTAEILGENYKAISEKFYLGFQVREATKLERHYRLRGDKCTLKVHTEFEVKHFYFDLLHESLNNLGNDILAKIMPSDEDFQQQIVLQRIPYPEYRILMLDKEYQFPALQMMLFNDSNAPLLIPGPFGTGKTRLLAVGTYNLIEYGKQCRPPQAVRVLVCCHHQISADTFLDRYFNSEVMQSWDTVVIRVTRANYAKSKYSNCYLSVGQFKRNVMEIIRNKYLVVVTTFLTAHNIQSVVGKNVFTHILIDEGAQTREPETIAPLSMANGRTKIVIAGDNQQVGPQLLVLGEVPQAHGLSKSLLERLLEHYNTLGDTALKQFSAPLRRNYRCTKEVLELPSKLFYQSKLIPAARGVLSHPNAPYPLVFVCSSIQKVTSCIENDTSDTEAQLLISKLVEFLHEWPHREWKRRRLEDVCVMAISRRQISVLKHILRENHRWLKRIQLFPTYTIQGHEFRALFISTVECVDSSGKTMNPTKSLCNPYVFNTAITRARSLVVAVGNPFTLLSVEANVEKPKYCWKEFITRCLEHNSFIIPDSIRDGSRNIPAEIQHSLFTQAVPACIKMESLPVDNSCIRSSNKFQPQQNDVKSVKPQRTGPTQVERKGSSLIPREFANQTKPTSTKQLGQQTKPASMQLSSPQQPKLQPSPNQSSVPAAKQAKPKQPQVNQQDHPKTTLQQISQRSQSQEPCHTVSTISPEATRNSTHLQPKVSSQYSYNFPTLEEAAKVPMWKKQHCDPSVQQNRSLSYSQSSHYFRADHDHCAVDMELLKSSLTPENYRKKFHQLLCREEEEHERLLAERCNGIYELTIYQPGLEPPELSYEYEHYHKYGECLRYGYITADHLDGDKIAYAKHSSEGCMYIFFPDSSESPIRADIVEGYFPKKKGPDVLFVSFNDTELVRVFPTARKQQCSVRHVRVVFELKYSYFYRQHDTLDNISDEVIAKIVPLNDKEFTHQNNFTEDYCPSGRYRNIADLDHYQVIALKAIMMCDPKAPLLVVGSFGTGKTRLLARAAMQIVQEDRRARVLVCAHHQSTADSYVVNYFSKVFQTNEMVRLMNPRYNPPPKFKNYYQTAKCKIMRNSAHNVRVIVTTLATSLHLHNVIKQGHFTHILIDEGAQSREPAAVAPLTLANPNTKIIIAGDHKQVGPAILVLGNEAQQYGLKVSLLERLHEQYKGIPCAETHCATLLNNYRCHKVLLSLPSYLFYNSALVPKADTYTQLHPIDKTPLHFICSDLDDSTTEVVNSSNYEELKMLLDKAVKYTSPWPDEWGPKDLSTICIMTATGNQKSQALSMVRSLYPGNKKRERFEVLPAYDIQGREFRAVFLSTAEPTTPEGKTKNPTKSPCSQYVFNTAITRSKSLVVCAGNPFLLMKMEQTMDNECLFWRDYIRRCIESKTFYIPNISSMPPEKLEVCLQKLQCAVFSTASSINLEHAQQGTDTILSAYSKAFEQIPQCKKCTVQLKAIPGSNSLWEITHKAEGNEEVPSASRSASPSSSAYKCELVIKSPRVAEAYPFDPSQSVVTINGLKNRHGAFDGDIVWVEVAKSIDEGKCIGKVVGIDQQCHQLKYVCKVDRHSAIHFKPIDKKSPRLVNLPKLSRGLIQNYKKEQIDSVMDKHAQQDYIVVFDEQSLPSEENPQLPKIKELISADNAEHLLFVVKVLGWLPQYRLPLGAVVDACPRGTTYFHAERLLCVAHNILVTDPDVSSEDDMQVPVDNEEDDTEFYGSAITIDPSDAKCLDDALSLTCVNERTYKVAVLIVNIAKFLKANSHISKEAEKRGTSVYGSREQSLMHMLPPSISSKLSLSFGDTRSVVCVSAKVVWENGSISSMSDVKVFQAKMRSKARLTYKQAQEILENKITRKLQDVQSCGQELNLNKTLLKLCEIAMHLRIKRINDAAYSYEISEAGEEKNWQAHLLVEELMIWANESVAKFVYQHLPENALLRQQVAPPLDTVAAFKGSFSSIGGYSLAMKHLDFRTPVEPLLVLKSTAKNIMDAVSSHNTQQLLWLLTCDNLYPQLAAANIQKALMGRRAEYVCTTEHESVPISANETEARMCHYPPYWHDTLRLSHYTHFTSPLRRYADVVVHRLLQAIFRGSNPDYSKEELSKLCQHLNLRSRDSREFQSKMDKLERAIEFGESCAETQAVIIKGEKSTYGMCFTDISFKPLHSKDMKIHQSSLNCLGDAGPDILRWKVKIVSTKSQEFLLTHPQLSQFSEQQEKTHEDSVLVKVLHKNEELSKQKPQGLLSDALVVSQFTAAIVTEVMSIPPEACQKIHDFIKKPSKANMLTVSKYYEPMPCSTTTKTPKGIASKIAQSPVVICDIQKSFKTGSVVHVWLGRSIRQPIMTPCLQLVEVAPEISICVEHNEHPAECFSDTSLCKATRAKYQSMEHYVKLWEKVLLAEAAHGSVNNSDLVLVRDVVLRWPKLVIPTNCTDNIHYIPNGDIMMEIPSESKNMMEYIDIEEGDLVCARYKLPTLRSVYHMVINDIETDEIEDNKTDHKKKLVRIYMKPISTEACRVSKKMQKVLQQNPACEIQLITLQPSFRRVYQGLLRLMKKNHTSLFYNVALGEIEVQKLNSGISIEQIHSVLRTNSACQLWDTTADLNEMQIRSIELGTKRRLQLIQGPPGTGKSVTGAHLAYTFAKLNGRLKHGAKGKCVVYCGPSNKAVDVVHDKLKMANKKHSFGLKLLRLYGRAHERKYFPGPCSSHGDGILPNLNVEEGCKEHFLDDALHKKVRSISSSVQKMDEEFELLHDKKLSPSPRVLKEYKNKIETAEQKVMADHYDVILCTCNETASRRMLQLAKQDRIAQCIVDESGMSHEPETITAISLCNHVVLIGDHKQLQPVIKYSPAKRSGMSTSLFERYAEHFPDLLITLDTQYRMHEAICQFPSLYFYNGCLKTDQSLKKRQIPGRSMEQFWPKGKRLPIVFCNVVGREEGILSGVEAGKEKIDPRSKCNKQEAEKVMQVVTVLHEQHGVDYREMAVITPYSAQKSLIHKLKNEKHAEATGSSVGGASRHPPDTKLKELTVVSITESQGDEYGYVILSTVRSQPVEEIRNHDLVQPDHSWLREHLGFLTDPHEINVGITRAKYGLIIIGNRWLLEYDETWKALIDHYTRKRCIVEGKEFPKV